MLSISIKDPDPLGLARHLSNFVKRIKTIMALGSLQHIVALVVLVTLVSTAFVDGQILLDSRHPDDASNPVQRRSLTDHERIQAHLFSGVYDKDAFPALKANDTLTVEFGVTLQAFELSMDGRLKAILWYNVQFKDPRLAWDKEQFGGISQLSVDPTKIWMPDIVLFNSVTPKMPLSPRSNGRGPLSQAVLSPDGGVLHVEPVNDEVHCTPEREGDLYGEYTCQLNFGSWTHNGQQLDLRLKWDTLDSSSLVRGDTELLSNDAKRTSLTFGSQTTPYVTLKYTLNVKRYQFNAQKVLRRIQDDITNTNQTRHDC